MRARKNQQPKNTCVGAPKRWSPRSSSCSVWECCGTALDARKQQLVRPGVLRERLRVVGSSSSSSSSKCINRLPELERNMYRCVLVLHLCCTVTDWLTAFCSHTHRCRANSAGRCAHPNALTVDASHWKRMRFARLALNMHMDRTPPWWAGRIWEPGAQGIDMLFYIYATRVFVCFANALLHTIHHSLVLFLFLFCTFFWQC